MKILLDLMDEYLNDKSFKTLKNKLYRTYKNGFYVYAEKKDFKNIKDGVEYVTMYCGSVAISENRILKYDGNNVTFCYNSILIILIIKLLLLLLNLLLFYLNIYFLIILKS